MLHVEALGAAKRVVPAPERCTHAGAVIGRRRLQVGRLERCVAQDARIGNTVERTAACHRQPRRGHQLVQPVQAMDRGLLETHLGGTGDVHLALARLTARRGLTQQLT